MARRIKTSLGTEVGLGPGDFVLDGDPPPHPQKGANPPIFGPCLLCPKGWMDQDATWCGGRPRRKRHCVKGGPSSPLPKKGTEPPIFGPYLLWPNGCMDQDVTWYGGRPRSRPQCVAWGPSSPSQKGHTPIFAPCLFWPNGRPSQLLLSTCFCPVVSCTVFFLDPTPSSNCAADLHALLLK